MEFDFFYIFFCIVCPILFLSLLLLFFRFQKKKNTHQAIKILSWNLLILLFLLSVSFTIGESYYRFFVDTTDSFSLNKTSIRWKKRHYHYNNRDIRDNINYYAEIAPNKKSRICIFGDSFSAGHGIKNVDDRFSNILRKMYPKIEVHNMAKNGINTHMQVKHLKFLRDNNYQADLFILAYCLNDIDQFVPNSNEVYKQVQRFNYNLNYFEKNSYLINTFSFRAFAKLNEECQNYGQFVKEAYSKNAWDAQQIMLSEFVLETKKFDAPLMVVTFPFLQKDYDDYEFKNVHQKINTFWESQGVPHLDLLDTYKPYMGNNLTVNQFDAHPNEYAHQLAAEAIDDFLKKVKL
tara:strand:+ start:300 stop:1343 length:1044 start_codon:yes stop_codon:yes gene_type:complete